jgi:hypothetical protein
MSEAQTIKISIEEVGESEKEATISLDESIIAHLILEEGQYGTEEIIREIRNLLKRVI